MAISATTRTWRTRTTPPAASCSGSTTGSTIISPSARSLPTATPTPISTHLGSSATVDGYSPGVYASYVDGGWYGNALFTYTFNSYTEDRNIAIGPVDGTNHGAPQGNQYTGSLTGGYEFQHGDLKYGPFAGVQYVNLDINSLHRAGPHRARRAEPERRLVPHAARF